MNHSATSERPRQYGKLLLVDGDFESLNTCAKQLTAAGYQVDTTATAAEASRRIAHHEYDVVISMVDSQHQPMLELAAQVRARCADVPVILVAKVPSLDLAMKCVEVGAFRFLAKPMLDGALEKAIELGVRRRRASAVRPATKPTPPPESERTRDRVFDEALGRVFMVFQPIVSIDNRRAIAFEALVRSKHETLGNPALLFSEARELGRLRELSGVIRTEVAKAVSERLPPDVDLFMNVHPLDLMDPMLFSPSTPLSSVAARVVLEITECTSLDDVPDVGPRLTLLRQLGFRIGLDDFGAGYAGLSSFALIEPEVAKLDMKLVRGVDADPARLRLIGSLARDCRDANVVMVGEGVETKAEADALLSVGCEVHQGYFYARPAPEFASVAL